MSTPGARLVSIDVVEDLSSTSRCDEGFLRVARLRLRNAYEDGSHSEPYRCDVVSRPGVDAVVAVLYEVDAQRRVRVLLREAPRAPIYLRRHKRFVHPDPREYTTLVELVAGIVEETDPPGETGLCHRASAESAEEAGIDPPAESFRPLGGETFASPGTSDEKLYFRAAAVALDDARGGDGDGSPMEEGGRVFAMDLADAIAACRSGAIPDMKTEVGLLRLADAIGYLPQLRCFVDELPASLAAQLTPLCAPPSTDATEP